MSVPILPGCSCGQKNTLTQKLWRFVSNGEQRGDIHVTHYECIACDRRATLVRLDCRKAIFAIANQALFKSSTTHEEKIRRALLLSYDELTPLANDLLSFNVHRIADKRWQEEKPTPTMTPILIDKLEQSPARHLIALPAHDECLIAATF